MPHCEFSGGPSIHYEERGTGLPLVLVHGWGMSGKVWAFQEELAAVCRPIAVDLKGHGKSGVSLSGYAFADLAADLVALFDHLGLERAVLLGWSMGAQVVLESFPALRKRLTALVIVSGTPKFTTDAGWPHGLPPTEARGLALRLRRDYDRALGDFFKRMFAEGELTAEQYQRIVRDVVISRRVPDPRAVIECLQTLAEGDHRHLLGQVDIPTLIVHGDRDTICLPGAAGFMAEKMTNARLAMMQGTGHAPFLSRPAEFNRLLADFLRETYDRD